MPHFTHDLVYLYLENIQAARAHLAQAEVFGMELPILEGVNLEAFLTE